MEIFDISQTLHEEMAVWPGDPNFRHSPVLKLRNGASSNLSRIEMGTHSGTHMDAPLHIADDGIDVAGIPLHSCLGPARVIEILSKDRIRVDQLRILDLRNVTRVLFKTQRAGFSRSEFRPDFVSLDRRAAEFLADKGIMLVGIDSPSVDGFDDERLEAHQVLVSRGIVIVEGLRLEDVPPGDYNLSCVPLKLAGLDGSPVRAVLWK